MFLSDIINGLEYKYTSNYSDTEITGVCCDSNALKKGEIFVCVKGADRDGHAYAKEAVKKGAAAIIASEELNIESVPVIYSEDTGKTLAEASAAFYSHPEKKLRVIGITGTNGKTTVSYMLKNILERCGYKVGLIGTVQNLIGDDAYPASLTTPPAPELFGLLGKMEAEGVNYVVMEVSSHSLSRDRVYGIDFAMGIMTNITLDHLDFHKTEEDYAGAKALLFKNSRISVLNKDDKYYEMMKEAASGIVVSYSKTKDDADVCGYDLLSNINGISFNVKTDEETYRAYMPLPGSFNAENALAAIAAATALKIPSGFTKMALKVQKGIPGRIEKIETGKDFSVIIDYAHTPDGLLKILKTLNEIKEARLITLFGCGGDRDRSKRPVMGKIACENSDLVIITSDNPRSESPEAIIADITAGAVGGNYKVIPDRREAIKYALSAAEKGDIILLAGKGHETYQITSDGKKHFDEREIIEELL